jgi:hypothetical protein
MKVQVSDIPYSEKFGSAAHVDKTLGEYIEEVRQHSIEGGRHPWYVFKGNVIPRMSDARDSLVRIQVRTRRCSDVSLLNIPLGLTSPTAIRTVPRPRSSRAPSRRPRP